MDLSIIRMVSGCIDFPKGFWVYRLSEIFRIYRFTEIYIDISIIQKYPWYIYIYIYISYFIYQGLSIGIVYNIPYQWINYWLRPSYKCLKFTLCLTTWPKSSNILILSWSVMIWLKIFLFWVLAERHCSLVWLLSLSCFSFNAFKSLWNFVAISKKTQTQYAQTVNNWHKNQLDKRNITVLKNALNTFWLRKFQ